MPGRAAAPAPAGRLIASSPGRAVDSGGLGLIKQRPRITLLAPREVAVEQRFPFRVQLDCPVPLPTSGVDVELVGSEVCWTESQYGRHREQHPFARATLRLFEGGELEVGHHELRGAFALPSGVPGSYRGETIAVDWVCNVRVRIPWWPDARASFVIRVIDTGGPPTADGSPTADDRRVYVSSEGGPRGRRPYLECSLGSLELRPGQALSLAVSFGNVEHNDYRGLLVRLVAVETIRRSFGERTEHRELGRWTLPVGEPEEGETRSHRLRLPEEVSPGYEHRFSRLRWYLEVRAEVAWAPDPRVWIPVHVRLAAPEEEEGVRVPLAVGSERLQIIWKAAAESAGFELRNGEMRRRVGGVRCSIRREQSATLGLALIGELRFPSLGIGMQLEGKGSTASLRARDDRQTQALSSLLGELIPRLPVVEATDELLRLEVDDRGMRVRPLVNLAVVLVRLANRLNRIEELPPPADLAARLEEFRLAAERLGGRLRPHRMSIVGRRGEEAFALRVERHPDGVPARLEVEVRPPMRVDRRFTGSWLRGETIDDPDIASLLSGARALEVTPERARLVLELDELEIATARVDALIAHVRRLTGRRGPYR